MKFVQIENEVTILNNSYNVYFLASLLVLAGAALTVLGLKSGTVLFAVVGSAFTVAGIAITALASRSTVTIERGGQTQITLARIGHKKQQSFATSSVKAVRLVGSFANQGRESTIMLVLNDGSSQIVAEARGGLNFRLFGIPLTLFFHKPLLQDQAQKLATFLQVPIDQNDLASAGGIMHTTQEVMDEVKDDEAPGQVGGLVPPEMRAQIEELQKKKAEKEKLSQE